jgi:flagellar motor switch protein FliM
VAANVQPEEVEALLSNGADAGVSRAGRDVETRDFRRPRRLSPSVVAELRRAVEASLPSAERELAKLLHGRLRLELGAAHEVDAQTLLGSLQEPMALVRFDAGGHPAWARWEIESATLAVEQLLGASEPRAAVRELSSLERTVLRTLIEGACRAVGSGLGLQLDNFQAVAQRKAAGHWRDAQHADPHRLGLELHLDTPAGQSSLGIYLPIFDAQLSAIRDGATLALPVDLPGHLERVEVTVAASLGHASLPLSELLSIEVGDVLQLDARRGDPLRVIAEGRDFGQAELGSKRGILSVRLHRPTNNHAPFGAGAQS